MAFRGAELAVHRGAADAQGACGFGNVAARVLYGLANEGGFGCAQRCRAAGYGHRRQSTPSACRTMSAADGAADNGVSCYNNYSYLRFIHKRWRLFWGSLLFRVAYNIPH